MMTHGRWRTVAAGLLAAAVLMAGAGTTAATAQDGGQGARYCREVDAYRIKTCATALLPPGPLGRQLGWELVQLAGKAATLTEAEVRAHFSAEFLTVAMPPEAVIQLFQQSVAERGPFTFVGFAYPPRARLALRRSPLRPMPLVVLTRGRPEPAPPWWPVEQAEALWLQLQRVLAQLVPGSRHVITQSGHNIPDEQPELVLDAVRDVVHAVRADDRVST